MNELTRMELEETFTKLKRLFEAHQLSPLSSDGFRALYQMATAIKDKDQTVDFTTLKDELKDTIQTEIGTPDAMELAKAFYLAGKSVLEGEGASMEAIKPIQAKGLQQFSEHKTEKNPGGRPATMSADLIRYLSGMPEGSSTDKNEVAVAIGCSDRQMFRLLKKVRDPNTEFAGRLAEIGVGVRTEQTGKITCIRFHRLP